MSKQDGPFTQWLPVTLTDKEKLDRGKALAAKLSEQDSVEEELTACKSTFKGQLETIGKEVSKLQGIVNEGREYRDVECVIHEDWGNMRVVTVRTDTGEEVEARAMTLKERQALPFGN